MKKKILLLLLLTLLLSGCKVTKQEPKQHSLSDIVEEPTTTSETPITQIKPAPETPESPSVTETSPTVSEKPTNCTPKKFKNTYSYVYETKDKCINEGSKAFTTVRDTIDSTIFSFGCEAIADDCGTKWYGQYFNTKNDDTGEIIRKYY